MKLKIATNSKEKLKGIIIAFSRFFQIDEDMIEIIHQAVDSKVPEQPFDEETYIGALNRVKALSIENDVDFYISCEAGIEEFMGRFFNVQVVCIYDKNSDEYVFGKSAGWEIPSKDIGTIKNSTLDDYLRNEKGITDITQLLGNTSRASLVAQATDNALCSRKLLF